MQAEGYVRGACFDGMGWHYFKDLLAPNGTISWQASNLMPVVPMYDPIHGKFNAIFFASAVVQQVSTWALWLGHFGLGTCQRLFSLLLTEQAFNNKSLPVALPALRFHNNGSRNHRRCVFQADSFFPAANSWEPIPLTDSMQCANFCDSNCGFSGPASWDKRWST